MIKATKDIIKILPFDPAFKQRLLGEYDLLDPDDKYNIDSILWDAYDALYALKLDENILLGLQRVKEGLEPIDEDFYKRMRDKTEQDMQTEEVAQTTSVDLSDVRSKLSQMIPNGDPQTN